jgi:thiosulfate/3-mercaptopyruvate sulfurtransferase
VWVTRPLVDAEWVRAHLSDPGIVLVDVRWHPDGDGRAAYASAHLPGAVYLDAGADLAARAFRDGPGRHPLPSPEAFAATMGRIGVGDDDAVIAYDDVNGSYAARLWWMLRATGRSAAILDGGIGAWDGDLASGEIRRPAASFAPRPWPRDRIADADIVAEVAARGTPILLDARAGERYRGEEEPIDPVAGHIPGARSAPWASNLEPSTGRLLPPEALRRHYESLGVEPGDDAVVYCGSGLTATLDLLAMELAGLGPARLYEGSWSDWVSDPRRPTATGEDAGFANASGEHARGSTERDARIRRRTP